MLTLGNKLTVNSQPIYHFVNKYSIDFDGVDDVIITDDADTVLQNTTYSFWCKTSSTTANSVFGHGSSNVGAFHFNYDGTRPLLYLASSCFRYWNDNSAQDDGEWHHWVVYLDTDINNSKLYVDGVLQTVSSTSDSDSPNAYTTSLNIGSNSASGGNHFEGQIDEFAVFDRELTQAEITRMYNTYYSPNRVANGNFSTIGNEEVTNGNFSEIGSELITNGDFSSGIGWNGSISVSGGQGTKTSGGLAYRSGVVTSGKQYKIVVDVASLDGTTNIYAGGNNSAALSVGVQTIYMTGGSSNDFLGLNNGYSSGVGSVFNSISVKEVGQGWSADDGNISFPNNTVNFAGGGIIQNINQNNVFTQNKCYKFTFDVVRTSGTIQPLYGLGGSAITGASPNINASGTYTLYFQNTSNGEKIFFYSSASANFVGSITNVSAKEVGQNWTLQNGSLINNDLATVVANGSLSSTGNNWGLYQSNVFNPSKSYRIKFRARQTSGSGNFNVGYAYGLILNEVITSSFVDYSIDFTTTSDIWVNELTFGGYTIGDTFEVDNIVVQELKHDATNLMLNAGAYQSANPLITSTKSMEFDGVDDSLQLGSFINLGVDDFSLSFWVNLDSATNVTFAIKFQDNSNRVVFSTNGANQLSTQGRIGGAYAWNFIGTGTNVLLTPYLNKWTHIAYSIDRSANLLIFINGELKQTTDISSTSATNVDNTGNWSLGDANGFSFLNGKMTEVGAYNRALTSLEVASLYNQGMPTNLLANRNNYQSGNPTVFNTKQVDFDGTDDYLKVTNNYGSFTGSISMWFKRDNTGNPMYLIDARGDSANGTGYIIVNSSVFTVSSGTRYVDGVAQTTMPTDANWHHIVVTGMTLDIDEDLKIGSRYNQTEELEGNISQVGLFNSTLTADEVSSLYNHGLPIDLTTNQAAYESSSNLVGYWRMGSGTLDTYPLIADQTNATLGSELVTSWSNNDFSSFASSGSNITQMVSSGSGNNCYSSTTITSGKTYKLQFTSSQAITCQIRISPNTSLTSATVVLSSLSSGSNEVYFTAPSNYAYIGFYAPNSFTDTQISSFTLKQVNGNPAIMTNQTSSDIENGSPYANIVQNGTFDTDTNWTKGTGWTIANGKANATSASSDLFQIGVPFSLNKTYKLTYTISNYSQGNTRSILGGYIFGSTRNTNGTFTDILTPTNGSSNSYVYIEGQSSFTGSIDNVTVEEVNTGLQGYWKMGDGTNDEYPVIYDQVNPTLSSNIIVNGNFESNVNGWTDDSGATITWQTDKTALVTTTGDNTFAIKPSTPVLVSGTTYKVSFRYKPNAEGTFRVRLGGSGTMFSTTSFVIDDWNNAEFTATADGTNLEIGSLGGNITNFYIDDIVAYPLQGNPAIMTNMVEGNITNQYPLTKIRNYYRMGDGILDGYPIIQDQTSPNLAHIPTTNLLEHSERFTNGYDWTVQSGLTVTDNFATAPNGTQTASKIIGNGSVGLYQIKSITGNAARSVYLKSITGNVNVTLKDPQLTVTTLTLDVTTEWQRFELSEDNGTTLQGIWIDDIPASGIYIWGAQLEAQSQATAYIKSDGIAAVRKSSTTNLLEYSEDFSQSFWTKSSVTPTTGFVSPDGTNNAYKLVSTGADGLMHRNYTVSSGTTYTISVYLKTVSGTLDTTLSLGSPGFPQNVGAGGRYKNITVTNEWKRYSLTSTADASAVSGMGFGGFSGFSTGEEVLIWGMQLEEQTQAETYAKTTGLPVTIDLFTENNYGTMTNMVAGDIVEDTP